MAWHFLAMGTVLPLLSSMAGAGLGRISAGFSVEQLLAGGGRGRAAPFTSPGVAPWRAAPRDADARSAGHVEAGRSGALPT